MFLLTLLFIKSVLIPLVVGVPFRNGSYYKTICNDPECVKTADQLIKWMEPYVNPCDDFYQFTCGRIVDSGEPPASRDNAVDVELKQILEGPPLDKEIKCHKNVRQFYSLCMDEAKINQRGVLPAVTLLRQLGRWPLLDQSWSEDEWTFERAESSLQQYGLGGGLFDIYVDVDETDSDNNILHIEDPNSRNVERSMVKSMFPRVYEKPVKDKSNEELVKVISIVAKQININETVILESLKEAALFAKMLTKKEKNCDDEDIVFKLRSKDNNKILGRKIRDFEEGVDSEEDGSDSDDGQDNFKITINELQETFPAIDWRTLLNNMMPPSIRLKDDDTIFTTSSEYLSRLDTLLNTVSKKSVANYMMWYGAFKMVNYLSIDLNTIHHGAETGDDRWKHCIKQSTTRGLSLALASLLARKHIKDSTTIYRAKMIAEDLQDQLVKDLEKEDWVDKDTMKQAQKKISKVEFHIGYAWELLSNNKLDNHYKKMKMNTSNYFEATMDLLKWDKRLHWGKLELSAKEYDWRYDTEDLFTRNAFNSLVENRIEITGPELIFQNTFNSKVPLYIAYGDVGTSVGHELIHSLDNTGLGYNENGDMEDWVSEETMENFTDRARCIIDQYSSFKEPQTQLNVDGDKCQGETISDNGGLKLAYHAYRRAVNNMEEPGLPHLEHYTPDQLFFITAANYYCEIPDKEQLEAIIKYDPHPPNQFRVIGMMRNSPVFSKAFKCDKDDAMNPPDKCDVW